MDKLTKKLIIIVLILLGLFLFFQIFPNLLRLVLFLFKIILPFLLGFSLSFMLMPAVRFFQKRKIPHKISVIVVVSITGSILFFSFLLYHPFNLQSDWTSGRKLAEYRSWFGRFLSENFRTFSVFTS